MPNPSHRISVFPPTCQPRPRRGDPGDADPPLLRVPRAQGARLRRPRAHAEPARKLQASAASSRLVTMSWKCDISHPYLYTNSISHVACAC